MNTSRQTYRYAAALLCLALLSVSAAWSQGVTVSETNALPHPSAMLDVQSLTKGMLIPRMAESERLAIAGPANGLIVYQIQNTPNSRRGYWYYEATEPQWIHLGRGEYVGLVDQDLGTHDASYTSGINPISVGFSQITWFVSDISAPPAVLVIPEFTAVATPPDITEYCQPDALACTNFGRMRWIRVYSPETDLINTVGGTPPVKALIQQNTCSPDINYKYLPYDGGTYGGTLAEFNQLEVDFCNTDGQLGFLMYAATTSPKSFSFWVDLNHDGDFSDPGELVDSRNNLAASASAYWVFGSNFPSPGAYPPIPIPSAINNGLTKMRITIRENGAPMLDPCFPGDGNHKTYDFDLQVTCGDNGPPFFPNELNWCNVDNVTPFSARVACFDKNGSPTDMKFHYKLVPLD